MALISPARAIRWRVFGWIPLPPYPDLASLPLSARSAPLVLPWEHTSRDRLFEAKHRRFVRSRREESDLHDVLEAVLATRLSERTERRYRRPSLSQPHIDSLIQMALSNTTRYTDVLRAAHTLPRDDGRFSLETLLHAQSWDDVSQVPQRSRHPEPADLWRELRNRYTEWSAPLSMLYRRFQSLENRVVRLSEGANIRGLSPAMTAGTVLFLDPPSSTGDANVHDSARHNGWSRPMYALNRGAQTICGYLRAECSRYLLVNDHQEAVILQAGEMDCLRRVSRVVVPV